MIRLWLWVVWFFFRCLISCVCVVSVGLLVVFCFFSYVSMVVFLVCFWLVVLMCLKLFSWFWQFLVVLLRLVIVVVYFILMFVFCWLVLLIRLIIVLQWCVMVGQVQLVVLLNLVVSVQWLVWFGQLVIIMKLLVFSGWLVNFRKCLGWQGMLLVENVVGLLFLFMQVWQNEKLLVWCGYIQLLMLLLNLFMLFGGVQIRWMFLIFMLWNRWQVLLLEKLYRWQWKLVLVLQVVVWVLLKVFSVWVWVSGFLLVVVMVVLVWLVMLVIWLSMNMWVLGFVFSLLFRVGVLKLFLIRFFLVVELSWIVLQVQWWLVIIRFCGDMKLVVQLFSVIIVFIGLLVRLEICFGDSFRLVCLSGLVIFGSCWGIYMFLVVWVIWISLRLVMMEKVSRFECIEQFLVKELLSVVQYLFCFDVWKLWFFRGILDYL